MAIFGVAGRENSISRKTQGGSMTCKENFTATLHFGIKRLMSGTLSGLLLLLSGCQWDMYRGGLSRDGQSTVNTSGNKGSLEWSCCDVVGQNTYPFGPVIGVASSTGGGIFIGDIYGNVYSINPAGKVVWTTATNSIGATPNAVGIDGDALVLNGDMFDVSESGVQWTFAPPTMVPLSTANLAVDLNGTIYTGDECGVFYALNPNGTINWQFTGFEARPCNSQAFSPTITPAVSADDTIYTGIETQTFPQYSGVLFSLSSSGTLNWSTDTYVGTPAVFPNGNILVRSLDTSTLYALNSSGALQWELSAGEGQNFTLPAIASNNTVYVGTAFDGLWSISPSGTVIWKASPDGNSNFFAPPTIGGDGTIYIAYTSLYAVNPNGTTKWSAPLCNGNQSIFAENDEPVIGNGGVVYMLIDGFTGDVDSCPLQAFN
jgi:hypothetical protein